MILIDHVTDYIENTRLIKDKHARVVFGAEAALGILLSCVLIAFEKPLPLYAGPAALMVMGTIQLLRRSETAK